MAKKSSKPKADKKPAKPPKPRPLFASRARAERERLGLTTYQLADRLGTIRQWVTQLETTAGDPHLSTIQRLIDAGMQPSRIVPEIFEAEARYLENPSAGESDNVR